MDGIYTIHKVWATREGLQGKPTASGFVIPKSNIQIPFVALPSVKALGCHVLVYNPVNGFSTIAMVMDVGPHFTDDDDYVFGKSVYGPRAVNVFVEKSITNPAGIDLGEIVWKRLGMKDNGFVEWRFLVDSYLLNLVK